MIEIRRGSTPRITCKIPETIAMENISNVWVYVSQNKKLIVDRNIETLDIDVENHSISVVLTQQETLALAPLPNAIIQIRLYLSDGTSLPSTAEYITVLDVYKDGVIGDASTV